MKLSDSKIKEFKNLYFLGIQKDGSFAIDACFDLDMTAKLLQIKRLDAELILDYLTELAKKKNSADIDLTSGVQNASDVDIVNFLIRVKNFDITDYIEGGEIDVEAIKESGNGDLIINYELSDKGVTKLKLFDKAKAIEQMQAIKEKQKDNSKLSDKIKAITFFDDTDIDINELQKELDNLKNK